MDQTEKQEIGRMTGNKKKAAAGLDALKNLQAPKEPEAPAAQPEPVAKPRQETGKSGKVVFSLHLPEEAHNKLRELSFHERNSMTKLILEGVDLLFAQRGLPSIEELKKDGIQ